jgi:hypothetical protein
MGGEMNRCGGFVEKHPGWVDATPSSRSLHGLVDATPSSPSLHGLVDATPSSPSLHALESGEGAASTLLRQLFQGSQMRCRSFFL